MKRIYKLNGVETPLDQILSYLEQELIYNGDTSKFEALGIDFEDTDDDLCRISLEDMEKIIKDYDTACVIAEKCYGLPLDRIYEIFDELGYNCHNYAEEELFDMELGNLTLTYLNCYGIDKCIQVWVNEEDDWIDTDIDTFKQFYKMRKGN